MKRANDGQRTSHHPKSSVFFRSEMCDGYTYLPYQWEQPEEQFPRRSVPNLIRFCIGAQETGLERGLIASSWDVKNYAPTDDAVPFADGKQKQR
ncbi:hypothetical protein ALC62_09366 [Cyphomyrmex costatus]|uniref:Uncharacterized protein n=1 Tax=Cyphomyrmex costatus TaxID=456900 RepID=A0A195CI45_9HYME|nr:hypothetical protein ALC62_09366 [Cyphomyrmex costatus]